jgi:hypothetical protein
VLCFGPSCITTWFFARPRGISKGNLVGRGLKTTFLQNQKETKDITPLDAQRAVVELFCTLTLFVQIQPFALALHSVHMVFGGGGVRWG